MKSLRTSVSKTLRRITSSISIPGFGWNRKVVRTRSVGTGMESGSGMSLRRVDGMRRRSQILPITTDITSHTQQVRRKLKRLSISSQTRLVIEEGHYQRREEGEMQLSPAETNTEFENLDPSTHQVKKVRNRRTSVVFNAAKESIPLYCRETFSSSLKRRSSRSPSVSPSFNSNPFTSNEKFLKAKARVPDTRLCSSRPRVRPVVIDVRPIIPGPESSLVGRTGHIELESYRRLPSSDSENDLHHENTAGLSLRRSAARKNKRSIKMVSKMSYSPEPEPPNFITRTDSSIRIPLPIGIYIQQKRSRFPPQAQQRLENTDLRRNSN